MLENHMDICFSRQYKNESIAIRLLILSKRNIKHVMTAIQHGGLFSELNSFTHFMNTYR